MSSKRICVPMLLVALLVSLACAVAWVAFAADEGTGTSQEAKPDAIKLTAEQIWQDIETFGILYRLKLTEEQAKHIAAMVAPVLALQAHVKKQSNRPEVLTALMELRAAAAAGKRITGEMWDKLARAYRASRPPGEAAEEEEIGQDRVWRLARNTGLQILTLLSQEQVNTLAMPEVGEWAQNLLEEIGEARNEPPEEWAAWKQERIEDIVADRPKGPANFQAQLDKLFTDARALTPDEFFRQRDELLKKLHAALTPALSDEEAEERAAGFLAGQMLENARLIPCLQEYVKRHAAKPTQ